MHLLFYIMLMLLVLRQNKICVFPVTCLKIIGSVGLKLFKKFFFFKKVYGQIVFTTNSFQFNLTISILSY